MAGCARPRHRQLIALALPWLAGAAFAQAPAGTAPVAPPARAAHAHVAQRGAADAAKSDAPDAALIEYLGEFGDAADGLDAMGLAEPEASGDKADAGKKPEKGGGAGGLGTEP